MARERSKDKSKNPDWPRANDGTPVIAVVIPKALRSDDRYGPWRSGSQMRLLSQLASDHFFNQPTLRREQLAELVELFKDEPLPYRLRALVVAQLNGTRCRKQGRKHVGQIGRELLERFMLPAAYDEAMKDAQAERHRHKTEAKKRPRRAPVAKIPTQRSLALSLVRERLPSFAEMNDARLINLVSEMRARLSTGEDPD